MIGQSSLSDRRLRAGAPPSLRALAWRGGGLLALSAACAITVALGWESPIRTVLAIAFLMLVPGLAVAELLDIRDLAQRLTVATAGSLAFDAIVSMVLLYAHDWSIGLCLAVLIAISAAALAGAAARARPRRSAGRLL